MKFKKLLIAMALLGICGAGWAVSTSAQSPNVFVQGYYQKLLSAKTNGLGAIPAGSIDNSSASSDEPVVVPCPGEISVKVSGTTYFDATWDARCAYTENTNILDGLCDVVAKSDKQSVFLQDTGFIGTEDGNIYGTWNFRFKIDSSNCDQPAIAAHMFDTLKQQFAGAAPASSSS